jgi:hypothetical protein
MASAMVSEITSLNISIFADSKFQGKSQRHISRRDAETLREGGPLQYDKTRLFTQDLALTSCAISFSLFYYEIRRSQ